MRVADHGEGADALQLLHLADRGLDERLQRSGGTWKARALSLRGLVNRHQDAARGGAARRTNRRFRRCTYCGALARVAPSASEAWSYNSCASSVNCFGICDAVQVADQRVADVHFEHRTDFGVF